MLSIKNLHVFYGGVHALKGISLEIPKGKIVTLLGANGAGKSTTLRAICGLAHPGQGEILLEGKDIGALQTFQRVQAGLAMVPEGRRVFSNLTVLENLRMGAYSRTDPTAVERDLEQVYGLFPRLKQRLAQKGSTLSGGEQQMLAIGRALMSRPKLLLMDEPSLGLAPNLVTELFGTISQIHREGMTILLVEQNAMAALEIADYGYALELGQVVLQGSAGELASNDAIRKAYMGS
jgi:branched-chain amino acid transport system ATP-binding protein